jgi:hypothetical protein
MCGESKVLVRASFDLVKETQDGGSECGAEEGLIKGVNNEVK